MPRSRQRGFTLLELIAVLVIVVVMVTMAGVSVSRSIGKAKIRGAAKELVAAMRYTRGQAIVTRSPQALELNVDDRTYTAPKRPAKKLPDEIFMKVLTADSDIDDRAIGRIRFFPDGSSTGGRVTLLWDEREWRVEVAWLTGEVRLDRDTDPA